MKFISTLLLMVITGFTIIPCNDQENDHSCDQEIAQTSDHANHTDFDFCPPLCTCSCCHSHITAPVFLSYTSSISPTEDLSSFYLDRLSTISFSIWQPPKIS